MAKKRFIQDILIPILVLFMALDIIALGLINPFDYKPIKGYGINLPAIGPTPSLQQNFNNLPNLPKKTTTTLQTELLNTSTTTPYRPIQTHPKPTSPSAPKPPPQPIIPPTPNPPVPNTTTINLGPAGNITVTKNPLHIKVTTPITSISVP